MTGAVTAAVIGGGAAAAAGIGGATALTAGTIGLGAAGVASSLYGANLQSSAAKSAAQTQANAENNATAEQQAMYNQNAANVQPFINQGTAASNEVGALEGLNGGNSSTIMNTLQQLPGYQFANTQGLKAVQNAATERGLGISGAAQKGAAQFATNTANTYYNNLLTGVQNTANMGANAAGGLANVGATTGANIAGTTVGAGNALAQGTVNSAAAQAGGLTGATNNLSSAFYTNQILNSLNNNGSNGGGYNSPQQIAYNDQQSNANFLQQAQNSAGLPTGTY